MKSFNKLLILLTLALAVGCAGKTTPGTSVTPDAGSKGDAANVLTDIRMDDQDREYQVVLEGNQAPAFNVFKLTEPQRLVVDLSDTAMGKVKPVTEIENPVVGMITGNEYEDEGRRLTRVLLTFQREADYWVTQTDSSVVVHIRKPADLLATAEAQPEAESEETAEVAPVETAPVVEAKAEPVCVPGEPIVLQEHDRSSKLVVKRLQVKAVDGQAKLSLKASKALDRKAITVLRLCDPERMVVDLYGAKSALGKARKFKGDGKVVKQVRMAQHKDKLRLVLDLNKPLVAFDLESRKHKSVLAFLDAKKPEAPASAAAVVAVAELVKNETPKTEVKPEAPAQETVAEVKKEETAPQAKAEAPVITQAAQTDPEEVKQPEAKVAVRNDGPAHVESIDYKHLGETSRVEIRLSRPVEYSLLGESGDQASLQLRGLNIPNELEQSLDTSEFNGSVSAVNFFNDGKDGAKVVVQLREAAKNDVSINGNVLAWTFDNNTQSAQALGGVEQGRIQINEDGETVMEYNPQQTAGMEGAINAAGQLMSRRGDVQRISLELKDTDIRDVLRLIADVSRLNIITSDEVQGAVTVRLLNVPWDSALKVILRSKQLGQEREGNIIRIATLKELEEETAQRLSREMARRELEPLNVRLVPVSYSRAEDMVEKLKDLLSERGTVSFDERTNVLIVKDVEGVLKKAEDLVSKLDLQTPQVTIESKIVEMEVEEQRGFGIQWGGYFVASEATGNPTGLSFPSSVGLAGATSETNAPGVPNGLVPNYVVNTPVNTPTSGIGLNLGNVSNTFNLSLRLTAMETMGKLRIISSPKITTMDNREARIQQGLQIPLIVINVTGQQSTKMVDAILEMKVTPHITADGSVMMKIDIKKEEPDYSRVNALGDPTMVSKEAHTEVLVRTGETTVIGGIYTRKYTEQESGVPFLSQIPVLGWLFKGASKSMAKTELLIFLTPRIINRAQSTLADN